MKKKKYLGIGLLFVFCFLAGRTAGKLQAAFVPAAQMTVEKAKLAVIIDDFGYNGAGTAEMLALDIPFTGQCCLFLPIRRKTRRRRQRQEKRSLYICPWNL